MPRGERDCCCSTRRKATTLRGPEAGFYSRSRRPKPKSQIDQLYVYTHYFAANDRLMIDSITLFALENIEKNKKRRDATMATTEANGDHRLAQNYNEVLLSKQL